MVFSDTVPSSWKDLQDKVTLYLSEAGYTAISPHTINTARGKVEVDVYVESPDPLVRVIICECKYWNSPVTKEKVHAFRTVVNDSGASLGLIISKTGFQSGAIEAARYSNVQLYTWESFLGLICKKWIFQKIKSVRSVYRILYIYSDPMSSYIDIDKMSENQRSRYLGLEKQARPLMDTCPLLYYNTWPYSEENSKQLYGIDRFNAWDTYINHIIGEGSSYIREFKKIMDEAHIYIPESKFEDPFLSIYPGIHMI